MSNAWLAGENQNVGSGQRETRWLTPKPLVQALGTFDLDPAGAPGHDLAIHTYLLENGDDGLRDEWFGRIWLNPPYGKQAEPFLRRMVEHGTGTALLFARTETKMFHELVWGAATAVLFLKGRLVFWSEDGNPARANAGAPSCLVAYGHDDGMKLAHSGLAGQLVWLASTFTTPLEVQSA